MLSKFLLEKYQFYLGSPEASSPFRSPAALWEEFCLRKMLEGKCGSHLDAVQLRRDES